jgi:hypothetical protein
MVDIPEYSAGNKFIVWFCWLATKNSFLHKQPPFFKSFNLERKKISGIICTPSLEQRFYFLKWGGYIVSVCPFSTILILQDKTVFGWKLGGCLGLHLCNKVKSTCREQWYWNQCIQKIQERAYRKASSLMKSYRCEIQAVGHISYSPNAGHTALGVLIHLQLTPNQWLHLLSPASWTIYSSYTRQINKSRRNFKTPNFASKS